jgi:hypothetical protein|tara:strand:- start:2109 stop:2372 length:264 start_codon:yes stop_codon:yes gene_type:complete
MKLFLYKSLFVFFLAFLLFKLTIGSLMKTYENKIDDYLSKENLNQIKQKLREEMYDAVEKENYLKLEDAELINKFLKKLQKEIFDQN